MPTRPVTLFPIVSVLVVDASPVRPADPAAPAADTSTASQGYYQIPMPNALPGTEPTAR